MHFWVYPISVRGKSSEVYLQVRILKITLSPFFHVRITIFGIIKKRLPENSSLFITTLLSSLLNLERLQVDEKRQDVIVRYVSCFVCHLHEIFQRQVEEIFRHKKLYEDIASLFLHCKWQ